MYSTSCCAPKPKAGCTGGAPCPSAIYARRSRRRDAVFTPAWQTVLILHRSLTGYAPKLDVGAQAANFTTHIWSISGQACAIVEAMERVASNRDSDTVAAYRQ